MRFPIAIALLLTLFGISIAGQTRSSPIHKQLAELNRTFTYKGKAIHPGAIKDMCSWVADPLPGPIAINVAGTLETNRYFGDYETRKNGFIYIEGLRLSKTSEKFKTRDLVAENTI